MFTSMVFIHGSASLQFGAGFKWMRIELMHRAPRVYGVFYWDFFPPEELKSAGVKLGYNE